MLVGTLGVLNASINRPVGMSNVRMMESRDATTSQRESGEKVYAVSSVRRQSLNQNRATNHIKYPSTKPLQLSHYPPCFDVHYSYNKIIANHRQ